MNKLEKIMNTKKTENGDKSYKTTGNNMVDILFLSPYLEKHLDEVTIGTSEKEKLLAMYIRDPRFGMGRRDLGRRLMQLAKVTPYYIAKAGRFDDLWHIPTDINLEFLQNCVVSGNELAKKWLPRLTGKDGKIAKALCKEWNVSEKEYRQLIKNQNTTEYKLSYAELGNNTELNALFNQKEYIHPLVDTIDFEKVPSLAMKKYLHAFSTRDDLKDRFNAYMQEVKNDTKKINVATANVVDAKDIVSECDWTTQSYEENKEIMAKKIIENETIDVELDAIVVLDTSGSMGWLMNEKELLYKAMAVAHAISIKSTYAPNQLISFSSEPKLMTIKGETLKEQYKSMYTGDYTNTDFAKVMKLLKRLKKYPEYLIVISDMEFDEGSNQSKEETMQLFKQNGANTKIIWWNMNDRNKTIPEFDEYGNIYLSGYNLQMLRLLNNKFNMVGYLDKILEKYKKDIEYNI